MAMRKFYPQVLGRDWWDVWDYPECIMDQCFGMQLFDDDLLRPFGPYSRRRTRANVAASGQSVVKNIEDSFKVSLNVKQFRPDELEVKVSDNYVVIHGKHEEKSDEHGLVSREFTRRYTLPKYCEAATVQSSLTPEGILSVTAPKRITEELPIEEHHVPIYLDDPRSNGDAR